jgi:hypothetical protein
VFKLAQLDLTVLGGWLVIAIAAVAIVFVFLKIVGKAIATSLRLAIILGSLVVIAVSLFVLSMLLNGGKLPTL